MTTPSDIFPNRHAFLIGVQAYSDAGIRPLKTPTHDIQLMSSALAEYDYQTHLCSDPDKATFVQFLESITRFSADGEAQIIIYYAGHGVALTQQQTDGPPTYGGYLLPIDARPRQLPDTAISMDWLAALIQKINGKQVLLILDCCYAGAVRQATSAFRGGIDTETNDIFQEDFGHYTRYRANQILTSSAHNQQALDAYVSSDTSDSSGTASPFATLLARALTNREADANRDGIVTVYELQLYIQQRLEAAASQQQHEQTSCLFAFSSHEGGEFVFLNPGFNPASLGQRQQVNPYKGLASYQPQDSTFFFGRDDAIRDLNRLLDASTFVVVVGASGTGKSSLVMGGLLGPRHRTGTTYAIMRPGHKPLAELARIRQNPPQLLLVDQMEELITQAGRGLVGTGSKNDRSDDELIRFFAELTAFQQSPEGRNTTVIATIRIEFVAQVNRQERFWNTDRQQYTIPVLDVDCLQEIIIRPALQTGMFYYPEKETVARIIEDFRHYPNALPLLSMALNELYETAEDRPERTIYERDYPGIGQILEHKELAIVAPFRTEIDFLRDLLLRFVAFQAGEYVRRRVTNEELNFGPERQPLCEKILKTMTENRLLSGRDIEAGDGYYELTHEALITAWSTYRQWIQKVGPAQLTQREELAEATGRYVQLGRRRAYTWGNIPLQNLIRVSSPTMNEPAWGWNFRSFSSQFGHLPWLATPERAFLARSFAVQRQNKLAQAGVGLLVFMAIGVALFFQSQDAYSRLLSNARYAESQNAYQTAQQDYEAADTLANRDPFLRIGRPFLRVTPDSLQTLAHLAGQRDTLYTALTRQLERADTLTTKTVLLLASRNDSTKNGTGVAVACRSAGQFIQTDVLYRALNDSLQTTRTRHLLDAGTVSRFRKRAQAGYQVTGVMRQNLLAICREVEDGYQLNGQMDLAAQYRQYSTKLDAYQRQVDAIKPGRQIALTDL